MFKRILFTIIVLCILVIGGIMPMQASFAAGDILGDINTHTELKHVVKKFAIAMSVVGCSCLILYLSLKTYKRMKEKEDNTQIVSIDVKKHLSTPETIDEATKLFIEKF